MKKVVFILALGVFVILGTFFFVNYIKFDFNMSFFDSMFSNNEWINKNVGLDNIMICKPTPYSNFQNSENIILWWKSVTRKKSPNISWNNLIYVYSENEEPVTVNNKDWSLRYIQSILTQHEIQKKNIASAFLIDIQTWITNRSEFIDIDALTIVNLSISWSNDSITGFESKNTSMLLGNINAISVLINNKDWIYIDPATLNPIKTTWTNQYIGSIFCALRAMGKDFLQVNLPWTEKVFFLDQKNLKIVNMYVFWTNDIITVVTDTWILIEWQKSTLVEINGKDWIYLNPKTLEKMRDANQPIINNSFSDL